MNVMGGAVCMNVMGGAVCMNVMGGAVCMNVMGGAVCTRELDGVWSGDLSFEVLEHGSLHLVITDVVPVSGGAKKEKKKKREFKRTFLVFKERKKKICECQNWGACHTHTHTHTHIHKYKYKKYWSMTLVNLCEWTNENHAQLIHQVLCHLEERYRMNT